MTVDGNAHVAEVEPRLLLLHHLRENLGIGGVHSGCNTTNCGACTVLLDGESVKSCTILAVQADGHEITTVQGITENGLWHPMQQAFHEAHGLQCGYCTPGMILASISLLKEKPDASEEEIREGLEGNLCRCTGYDLAKDGDKNPQATPAAVTGYGMSLEERSQQGGPPVTDTADTTAGQPVDEKTRTFVSWIPTEDTKIPNHWPVARGEVNYAGDIVAVVVATDRYKAQDALEFIEVDYEPMEPVLDVEAALQEGAPLVHEDLGSNESFTWTTGTGDIDDAFNRADVVVKERYLQQRLIPNAIETRGVVANPDPISGGYTVYSSTQIPHILRFVLATYCGVPEQQLRVVAPDVGGAFGSKLNVYAEEAIALVLARKLGVPVKWIEDRSENYLATIHGRGQVQYIELAANSEGKILGMRVNLLADMGAYLMLDGPGIPILGAFVYPGLYTFGAYDFSVTGVFTNMTPTDAYRGAGRPEAIFAIERIIEALAREVGLDPVEIRRRNFYEPFDEPTDTPAGIQYDSGNYQMTLDRVIELADYEGLREEQRRRRESGDPVQLGIGFSTYTEICGLAPSQVLMALGAGGAGWEMAKVQMLASGKVEVITGTTPHGQGHVTSWSQIAADVLGVTPDDVEVLHGDTAIAPYGRDTYGSP